MSASIPAPVPLALRKETMTRPAIDIATMNAADLTHLAFLQGLAPAGVRFDGVSFVVPCPTEPLLSLFWKPAEYLDQADAVFRALRAYGFETLTQTREGRGTCLVMALHTTSPLCMREWVTDGPRVHEECSEAMALLRVSVLAMAGEAALSCEPGAPGGE
jgi:hypothetical protein